MAGNSSVDEIAVKAAQIVVDELRSSGLLFRPGRQRSTAITALANTMKAVVGAWADSYMQTMQSENREPSQKENIVAARLAILAALERHQAETGVGVRVATETIARAFSTHSISGLEPWVYDAVRKISRSTLFGWRQRFLTMGKKGLEPKWRPRIAAYQDDGSKLRLLIDKIMSEGTITTASALRSRLGEEGVSPPSLRTCQRIMRKWPVL